jgi:hypothetical protein
VRENTIYRKGRYDDIILDLLGGNPCSRKELLELNKQKDSPLSKIPYSTLDKRLRQLEKYGYIKHISDIYRIAERVEEANPSEVDYHLEVLLNKDEHEESLYISIKRLRVLSKTKRIASLPRARLTWQKTWGGEGGALGNGVASDSVYVVGDVMSPASRTLNDVSGVETTPSGEPGPGFRDVFLISLNTTRQSPQEALEELVETIETWDLPKGIENSLASKLEGALRLLDKGNENGATRLLMAFINQVEALRDKKLTTHQADQLTSEAQRIIDLIKG